MVNINKTGGLRKSLFFRIDSFFIILYHIILFKTKKNFKSKNIKQLFQRNDITRIYAFIGLTVIKNYV